MPPGTLQHQLLLASAFRYRRSGGFARGTILDSIRERDTPVADRIALFMYGLTSGGVPRRMAGLANAFAERGRAVDLIVLNVSDSWDIPLHQGVRVVSLASWRTSLPLVRSKRRWQFAAARPTLERLLRQETPTVLISADNYANLAALQARRRAALAVPVIVTQRTHTSTYARKKPGLIRRLRHAYADADAVVGVSRDVVDDLVALGVPRAITHVIHNPVVGPDFDRIAAQPVDHPWFQPGEPPVVLGVGRIAPQKDFPTLIRAFSRAREKIPELRLVILGDPERSAAQLELRRLAERLGIDDVVDLPGGVQHATPYMARAALFALSSRWEGMPSVLIEALACGVPVVSTSCPGGTDEVLEGGRYGTLTPVGDEAALGQAIVDTLSMPPDRVNLIERGRLFSVDRSVNAYATLVGEVVAARKRISG